MRAARFTSELIRSSTRGLAGIAAAELLDRAENPRERYGVDAFEAWRQAIAARLNALCSALEAGQPSIFADDVRWFRDVSAARGIPPEDLQLCLDCIRSALAGHLPDGRADVVEPALGAARAALTEATESRPEFEANSAAAEFFDQLLLGDLGGARQFLAAGLRSGRFDVTRAILDVVLPAAREAGRRWHIGQLNIATEHVVTATLRSALHGLTTVLDHPRPNGKAAFVAAVGGDAHDTALIALAVLLEYDGWRVALAGANTPIEEIDATAAAYECDVIALSATLSAQRHMVSTYLAGRTSKIPVLVGGAAVQDERDALALGAQGYALDLEEAVAKARALAGLD